jgi:hypothetical protein
MQKVNVRLVFLVSLVPLLFFSGIMNNLLMAVYVFSWYEMGVLGLVTVYNSPFSSKPVPSLVLGSFMLVFSYVILEFSYQMFGAYV